MNEQINIVREIKGRLETVRERIRRAAERVERDPASIELVVVTKTHPPETIQALFQAGHETIGENRVQEAVTKMDALAGSGRWHFIGHVQRNKVKQIAGRFELIHSVDSARLIEELEKRTAEIGREQRILLELNVAGEEAKTGAAPEALSSMLEALAAAPHLRAEGLMTMAPYAEDPEIARPCFARLREIIDSLPRMEHFTPRHLSMGMSGDFEVGIEEGSTIVRIGTAVLGPRRPR
jgi:pyridoxal phosphate enzyme (YggS family)